MKKPELIDAIAAKTGKEKKDVTIIVDSVFDTIVETIKSKEVVDIYGFGKFESVYKEARMGKNPKTGEEKMIEAKNSPKLRYSSAVKKAINS